MSIVNIHEAKTHFSKLVDCALNGDEVIIAKAGKPAVKLVPIPNKKQRLLGVLKGKVKIGDDFDDLLPDEFLDSFEGK